MAEVFVKKEDEEWVKELIDLKEHSDRARLQAYNRWNESWRIYNNQYDWSNKAKWQARNFVPKLSMTVEMAASLVRRAMLDANEWFRYDGTTETSKRMGPLMEKLAYWYLDRLRFLDMFVPPMKGGFVGSLIALKLHLAPYSLAATNEEGGPAITISYPDPFDLWLDGSGRSLFVIEDEVMDMASAFDLVDIGVLNGDVLKKLQQDWGGDSDEEVQRNKRKQQSTDVAKPSFRSEIKLTHFWGSLPKKFGRWAIQNGHYVMVNDKYLIRDPMENPYNHKKLPYIIGSPFRRPFSVYHKGLIEDVIGLQKAMTELLNLSLDSALFAGIKAFEVDLDQIEDPQQLLNGIYPGKVFTTRKAGQNTQTVRDVQIGGVSRDVVQVYGMLDNEFQNATAVTEFISGAMSSAPGRTATEVVTKQQQGMGVFGEVARNIEGTVLEPMLEQLASLIAQHHDDFLSEEIIEILGTDMAVELALTAPEDRASKFGVERIRVHASGISSLLNRTEEIQKINTLLQSLGQLGPMAGAMLADIDMPFFFKNLFRRLVRAYGWNEKDIIREKTTEEKAVEAAQAAAAAAPAGGVSPPGAPNAEGAAVPPALLQTQAQMAQIREAAGGGGIAPSPMGGT